MKMIYSHEQRQPTRKQMCSLFFPSKLEVFRFLAGVLRALKAFNHCKSAGKIKQNERIESGE